MVFKMKKLIERIKDTFRRDKLPQDISNHLESTRNIYEFIREDKEGKLYIPIPKEDSVKVLDDLRVNGLITKESAIALRKYNNSHERVIDWKNSINKTINMHSYLSAMNFKENMERRGYNLMLNNNEMKDTLIEGNDYILN